MIILDGNQGEGGGAILRYALALSTITEKPFFMKDIRKGRDLPGLKAQHLSCIKALEDLCEAKAEHQGLGSQSLAFHPRPLAKERMRLDIGTAGSTTLLLQSLLIPLIFSRRRTEITLIGGTDVAWSQPSDYFLQVFLPHLAPYASIDARVERRGFYPKGGGRIVLDITGKQSFGKEEGIPAISIIRRGKLNVVQGIAFATASIRKADVAERMKRAARNAISLPCKAEISTAYDESSSDGAGIVLWASYDHAIIGADCLGKKNLPAEEVGKRAATALNKETASGACVDSHLADQLIPYMGVVTAITGKECRIVTSEITEHLKSNVYVTEQFLDVKFSIEGTMIVSRTKHLNPWLDGKA